MRVYCIQDRNTNQDELGHKLFDDKEKSEIYFVIVSLFFLGFTVSVGRL